MSLQHITTCCFVILLKKIIIDNLNIVINDCWLLLFNSGFSRNHNMKNKISQHHKFYNWLQTSLLFTKRCFSVSAFALIALNILMSYIILLICNIICNICITMQYDIQLLI